MKAAIYRSISELKRGFFQAANTGRFRNMAWGRLATPFTAVATYALAKSTMTAATSFMEKRGNLDIYNALYTPAGQNTMSSGKRGIDSNIGGTTGLVQGLHSNRRRY